MAQLVARLVRNEKVGGSNPPSSTTGRHPIRMSVFCMPGRFVAPLVFRAPEGPAVGPGCFVCPWAAARPRDIRAASFARRVVSKPGQAPPPPTGTAARPSGPSDALHTGGACSVRRLNVWPGPAAAHGRRSLAPPVPPAPSTPVGPGVMTCCSVRHLEARPHCCRSPLRPVTHVKPSSPLLACAPSPVKPTTPLQARYTCFRRNFGEQRRHGFHGGVLRLPQWC